VFFSVQTPNNNHSSSKQISRGEKQVKKIIMVGEKFIVYPYASLELDEIGVKRT